jgi:serine/threonine-protein kinase
MDTFQNLGTPNRSRFGVFKLSKPKRLKSRHGLPDSVSEGQFAYRALSELDADGAWGTWLGEQREASGASRLVLLKHTGENNRTRAGADALWLEALLTLKLDGPHVVPLLDYGVLDGRPFAIYGFEEGVFLAQMIEGLRERGRRLPSGVAVGIILQACELVKRLHKLSLDEDQTGGFVHGSLCPRNFVLTERGDVKVMGLIGARPVGRVVGREHVPAAAMAYASPDLLGGAPVTPAVDVHSLGAVLQELLGDGSGVPEGEKDELGGIVRELLRQGPSGGFSTVDVFAAALQDAVRRTGTVVARQSISAQVRGICEQYLLERRRQVRNLRDPEWADLKESPSSRPPPVSASADQVRSAPSPDEMEEIAAAAEDSVDLGEYEEDAGDDAVTRIYDGDDLESEGPAQAQAWMHDSRPPDGGRSGWSRWAVVALLGVLVAVASGAAVMASRSMARVPQVASADVKVAAAGTEASTRAVVAKPPESAKVAAGAGSGAAAGASPVGALAAVSGQPNADEAAASSAVEDDLDETVGRSPKERRIARQRAAVRRAAARKAASRATGSTQQARASSEEEDEEPATVGVLDLPEADEEPEAPPAAPKKPAAASADGDLIIEDGSPKVAFLSVDASPYATVFIDGEKKGVTPLVRLELAPGLHRMVARTEDGRTKRYTLQLDSGKTEVLKVTWEE